MSDREVHVTAQSLIWQGDRGPHVRQRCAWCGCILIDQVLSDVSFPLEADGSAPEFPTWPAGVLLATDRHGSMTAWSIVEHDDEAPVPPDMCMRIDPAVTL